MTAMIRVGLVGLDHWYSALGLAETMARRDDMDLVGIADADSRRAADAARRSGVDRVEGEWEKLVEDRGVDAIASFVNSAANPEVCVAAARAGKHLLSTKPVARTLDDASRVVTAVREAGVHFLPAETRHRVAKQSVTLRRWLSEGKLGRLLSASFSLWASLPQRWPDDPDPGWFVDPSCTVGGAWVDHAIYQLDLMRFLLGEEVTSISGQVANLLHQTLPVEDWGVATVTFAGGTRAILEDTWTGPGEIFQQSMTLVGTAGAVRVDGIQGRMLLLGEVASPFPGWVEAEPPARHGDDIDHWLALIRGQAEPAATVEDAWRNLAACAAFYEAARSGKAVAPRTLDEGSTNDG